MKFEITEEFNTNVKFVILCNKILANNISKSIFRTEPSTFREDRMCMKFIYLNHNIDLTSLQLAFKSLSVASRWQRYRGL